MTGRVPPAGVFGLIVDFHDLGALTLPDLCPCDLLVVWQDLGGLNHTLHPRITRITRDGGSVKRSPALVVRDEH